MVRIAASKARKEFSELISRVAYQGDRVVLARSGKDVAALVSVADLARLEALEDQLDNESAEKALRKMKTRKQKPISWQRVKQKLKLK